MPRNGSGTYSLPNSPFVTGTATDATAMNGDLSDLGAAISASIAKDGQTTPTGNLPMGNFQHTGAAPATTTGQYLTYGQAGSFSGLVLAGAVTGVTDLTTTGNTILGDASTDTLNVGNGGIVKDASGNVGIGRTSTGGKLEVQGTLAAVFSGAADGGYNVSATGAAAQIGYNNSGGANAYGAPTGAYYIGCTGSLPLVFTTNASERMRIDASGNVGVGRIPFDSDSVGAPYLDLAGGLYVRQIGVPTNRAAFAVNAGTAQLYVGGATPLVLYTSGVARMQFAATTGDITALGVSIVRFKAADETRTSTTTLSNDADLLYAIPAAGTYQIELTCFLQGASFMKFAVAYSGTVANGWLGIVEAGDGNGGIASANAGIGFNGAGLSAGSTAYPVNSAATTALVVLSGCLTASTAGTVSLQWAQQASNGTATVLKRNSFLKVTKIA